MKYLQKLEDTIPDGKEVKSVHCKQIWAAERHSESTITTTKNCDEGLVLKRFGLYKCFLSGWISTFAISKKLLQRSLQMTSCSGSSPGGNLCSVA